MNRLIPLLVLYSAFLGGLPAGALLQRREFLFFEPDGEVAAWGNGASGGVLEKTSEAAAMAGLEGGYVEGAAGEQDFVFPEGARGVIATL